MVLGSFTISIAQTDLEIKNDGVSTFKDIKSHWGSNAINKWSDYGIVNRHNGFFRPNDSITRGEMAVILNNMMDYQVAGQNKFTDLKTGQFYTDAILKANAAGTIKRDGSTVKLRIRLPLKRFVLGYPAKFQCSAKAMYSTDSAKKDMDMFPFTNCSKDIHSVFSSQVAHYTEYIKKNTEWEFAGIFADDGISGTNTKKREEFNRMIEE